LTTTSNIAGAALAAPAPIAPSSFAADSHSLSLPLLNACVKRVTLSPQAVTTVKARRTAQAGIRDRMDARHVMGKIEASRDLAFHGLEIDAIQRDARTADKVVRALTLPNTALSSTRRL
jgi:hypothetical protein